MADWTKPMNQTFEYYIVDPSTWKDTTPLKTVKSCSISRDSGVETLGSATINITESVGECYIRIYLITIQNGVKERHPLGTFLVQTPSLTFTGTVREVTMDAYTPLLELKENRPPIGYSLLKGDIIMEQAYRLVRERARAPVVKNTSQTPLPNDFVSNTEDTWITFVADLIATDKFELALDEMGRILFAPVIQLDAMQPVFTYSDDNSSILHAELSIDHDLYGVPNVVEVIYSTGEETYYSRVVNDDSNSPASTVRRGREITYRVTDASFPGIPSQDEVDKYANNLLKQLSTLEYTITYTHGFNNVRLGDCIRLNYSRAGLIGVKAKVISQSIKCEPGCPVTEKAVYTVKLWR